MTGYKGRIGIYEFLEIDATIADAIRRNDGSLFTSLALAQKGFRPLVQRALDYAESGTTSIEEVIRVTAGLEQRESDPALLDDVLESEDRLHGSV
jgi:MSHA biogenesis protein MshE